MLTLCFAAVLVLGMQETSTSVLDNMKLLRTGAQSEDPVGETCEATVNARCGGGIKCCSDLVCSPVWDTELSRFGAKCVVADASLLDENICYDLKHKCFYNYQCCTGRCADDDSDTIYTCTEHTTAAPTTPTRFAQEPVGSTCYGVEKEACKTTRACMWRAASCYTKTTTSTTTVKPTKPPIGTGYGGDGGYGYGGGYGGDGTSFATADGQPQYNRVRNGIPAGAAVILGLFCLIAFVVGVSHLAKRVNSAWLTNQYKKLGVDKIPSKTFLTAKEDGAYFRQSHLVDNDDGSSAQNGAITAMTISKPMPQLPPRDYTLSGVGTADVAESDYDDSDDEASWSEDSRRSDQ